MCMFGLTRPCFCDVCLMCMNYVSPDLDRCGHTTPCENGTTCNNTGPDQYECLCAAGFTGRDCEVMINNCQGVECSRNGQCRPSLISFTCVCDPGYSGRLCEIRVSTTSPSGTPAGYLYFMV